MDILFATIVLWLSANFNLPASFDYPRVEFARPSQIAVLRYKGLAAHQSAEAMPATTGEIVSVYDDDTRTIFLPDGWNGHSPAESSILVHEMVHHLQNIGRLKFACPQEREQVAYEAQDRWLALFGRDLMRDFGMDAMDVFVKSKCFY